MKKLNKVLVVVLAVAFMLGLTGSIVALAAGSLTVSLGTADNFAVLAGSAITNVPTAIITGDVGLSPTTGAAIGLTTAQVTGTIYAVDGAGPTGSINNPGLLTAAKGALTTAYGDAAGRACTQDLTGQDLGGKTLTPGVYCFDTSAQLTGILTLNAQNDPSAVFIFKIGSTLTTAANSSVALINSGLACNVFWQVGSSATLGTTTNFKGNILALTSITLNTGTNVEGRVLAQNGAVALDSNTITKATCAPSLYLRKTVTNDNGGTALVTAWTLTATGTVALPTNLSGTTPVNSDATFKADTYTLAESGGPAGYTAGTYSCVKNGGAPVIGNSITLAAGDSATCTINNDDIAPQLTVTKVVTNDNSGTRAIADFSFFIDGAGVTSGVSNVSTVGEHTVSETSASGYISAISGDCAANGTVTLAIGENKFCIITNDDIAPVAVQSGGGGSGSYYSYTPPVPPLIDVVKVPSPLALPKGPGAVSYTYTLRNIGTVPVTNITMVGDTCSPILLVSGDTNSDSKLDVNETWVHRCTTTLTKTHTNTVVATGWANGISAVDIASSTVVVGVPIVPPLIHVTKIPSPLTLSAGGGMVTYTKKVTNPGTVALNNVRVTDDKCGPVNYISGDINGDLKLEPTETWVYTCKTNLTKTTTNTAIAAGEANGLTARDFAIATVVVAVSELQTASSKVPKLPNTGLPPEEKSTPWNIVITAGILILFPTSLVLVLRKSVI